MTQVVLLCVHHHWNHSGNKTILSQVNLMMEESEPTLRTWLKMTNVQVGSLIHYLTAEKYTVTESSIWISEVYILQMKNVIDDGYSKNTQTSSTGRERVNVSQGLIRVQVKKKQACFKLHSGDQVERRMRDRAHTRTVTRLQFYRYLWPAPYLQIMSTS